MHRHRASCVRWCHLGWSKATRDTRTCKRYFNLCMSVCLLAILFANLLSFFIQFGENKVFHQGNLLLLLLLEMCTLTRYNLLMCLCFAKCIAFLARSSNFSSLFLFNQTSESSKAHTHTHKWFVARILTEASSVVRVCVCVCSCSCTRTGLLLDLLASTGSMRAAQRKLTFALL